MEPVVQNQPASASQINSFLQQIEASGSKILNDLSLFKEFTLLQYQNRESYINSKRVLVSRAPGAGIPITISMADFLYIDQGNTTASIRGDSGGCTTRETVQAFQSLQSASFTSSTGDVSNLDNQNQLFQVVSSTVPTGQFDITFPNTLSINLVVFDILASPGTPDITVFTSPDGLTYTKLPDVAINGYRVTAAGNQADTKYVRVVITPSTPDLLNGISYSFGLTSLTVRGSSFALRSQFYSKSITLSPLSSQLFFGTDDTDGITYYLSLSTVAGLTQFIQVEPNSVVPLPGSSFHSYPGLKTGVGGQQFGTVEYLYIPIPTNAYVSSLRVTETTSGQPVVCTVLPNLAPLSDPNSLNIQHDYFYLQSAGVAGTFLCLQTKAQPSAARTFTLSFSTGPTQVYLTLKAVLDSSNRGSTPIFRQAYFEAV